MAKTEAHLIEIEPKHAKRILNRVVDLIDEETQIVAEEEGYKLIPTFLTISELVIERLKEAVDSSYKKFGVEACEVEDEKEK